MLKRYQCIYGLSLIASLMLLSACTRSVSDVDSQGKMVKPVFPDVASAVRPEGSFVNLDNLRQVKPGMTKDQLYELIGVPHFKEGMIRVKEWDYIFHFSRADKSVLTCQYKVLFDNDMKAQSFFYKPEGCLDALNAATVKPVTHQIDKTLAAESLFGFGSATLSREGETEIRQMIAKLKKKNVPVKQVVITGHSDRIGSREKNNALSLARADAVKNLFVEEGISETVIETRGMGDSQPVVVCPGKTTPAVVACLAKNRRITINILE